MLRNDLQDTGYKLAKIGQHDEAIAKFNEAIQPTLLNTDHDKSTALWAILRAHQRQGKFAEALYELNLNFGQNKNKTSYIDKQSELLALLESQKTGSPKPVYDHIAYLRKRYKKFIPPQPKGDSGFHSIPISDIIHLYNYMGDANGGIKFMDEVLSSKSLYPAERKEYERVKQAFKEDKRTGQKGHLQKVIETSSHIGW